MRTMNWLRPILIALTIGAACSLRPLPKNDTPNPEMGTREITDNNMADEIGQKAIEYMSLLFHKASGSESSNCGKRALSLTMPNNCTRQVVNGARSSLYVAARICESLSSHPVSACYDDEHADWCVLSRARVHVPCKCERSRL